MAVANSVSALVYLSVHCSVTLGLPKLNNMQRGAKLKHLGQEKKNSTRDVSSWYPLVTLPTRFTEERFRSPNYTSAQTKNGEGLFGPLQLPVILSWNITWHIIFSSFKSCTQSCDDEKSLQCDDEKLVLTLLCALWTWNPDCVADTSILSNKSFGVSVDVNLIFLWDTPYNNQLDEMSCSIRPHGSIQWSSWENMHMSFLPSFAD